MSPTPPPPITPGPSGSGLSKKAGPFPLWIWLLIVVALIGGGVAFASSGGGDDDAKPDTTNEPDQTDDPDQTDAPDETDAPDDTAVALTLPTAVTTPVETVSVDTVPATAAPTTVADLPYQLAVTESWFYVSGDNTYDYGGIVENTGTQTATGFIEVEIDFYDATDRILSTESAFVDTVVGGVRTPFIGTLFEPSAPPVRMDVRLADDNFIDEEAGPVGALTIANVATADDGFEFDVNGDATSTFATDLEFVQLVGLWRDANGTVVWTATTYLDRVPAGSTSAFTISSFSDLTPRVAPTEILFVP